MWYFRVLLCIYVKTPALGGVVFPPSDWCIPYEECSVIIILHFLVLF